MTKNLEAYENVDILTVHGDITYVDGNVIGFDTYHGYDYDIAEHDILLNDHRIKCFSNTTYKDYHYVYGQIVSLVNQCENYREIDEDDYNNKRDELLNIINNGAKCESKLLNAINQKK